METPRTPRETITQAAEGEGKFIRQSGGKGVYGHVIVKIAPSGRGDGVQVISEIVDGSIPPEFIQPATDGVREGLHNGVLAGYPVVDVVVRVVDGSFHAVDSFPLAFTMAGLFAVKNALKKAKPILIE